MLSGTLVRVSKTGLEGRERVVFVMQCIISESCFLLCTAQTLYRQAQQLLRSIPAAAASSATSSGAASGAVGASVRLQQQQKYLPGGLGVGAGAAVSQAAAAAAGRPSASLPLLPSSSESGGGAAGTGSSSAARRAQHAQQERGGEGGGGGEVTHSFGVRSAVIGGERVDGVDAVAGGGAPGVAIASTPVPASWQGEVGHFAMDAVAALGTGTGAGTGAGGGTGTGGTMDVEARKVEVSQSSKEARHLHGGSRFPHPERVRPVPFLTCLKQHMVSNLRSIPHPPLLPRAMLCLIRPRGAVLVVVLASGCDVWVMYLRCVVRV